MKPERTLILVKPDGVKRGLVGEIINRFERCGLTIVGLKMMIMDVDLAARHYQDHTERGFYPGLVRFMTSGPLIAMAIEGARAISKCRKLCGDTDACEAFPGSIRGDFGHSKQMNLVHSSDPEEEGAAERELSLFFNPEEFYTSGRAEADWVSTSEDLSKQRR